MTKFDKVLNWLLERNERPDFRNKIESIIDIWFDSLKNVKNVIRMLDGSGYINTTINLNSLSTYDKKIYLILVHKKQGTARLSFSIEYDKDVPFMETPFLKIHIPHESLSELEILITKYVNRKTKDLKERITLKNNELLEYLYNNKSDIITAVYHELSHALDFSEHPFMITKAQKDSEKVRNIKDKTEKYKTYVNSPSEMNAHFNHIVSVLNLSKYNTFQKYKEAFDKESGSFMKNLTENNYKNIIKRLYLYWNDFHKTK